MLAKRQNEENKPEDETEIQQNQANFAPMQSVLRMVEGNKVVSEYVEHIFSYLLEVVAFFDMGSDILFLIEIWKAGHSMWFMLSMFTIVAPYYICYVPLLRYQRRNMSDEFLKISLYKNKDTCDIIG